VLLIGNEKLGILDIKKVSHLDRKIAITIDFFYTYLYSCHNNSHELFIKNADAFFASAISGSYPDIAEKTFQEEFLYFLLDAGWEGWPSAFFSLNYS
jgi:hypothetical protein